MFRKLTGSHANGLLALIQLGPEPTACSPTYSRNKTARDEPAALLTHFWLTLQRPGIALALFLAAAFAIYAPVLNGELIWDDAYLVQENPLFRSPVFVWEVFRHYLFFDSFSTYYRPVQNWSYMLDYWLWRGAPLGYHITNITLHALSGFLLYRLLRRLLPSLLARAADARLRSAGGGLALSVALVWLVHPMHNAAVAYISGRADSLASLFALSAWLLARRAANAPDLGRRAACGCGAAGAMLTALCSKEIALVWLGLYVLHLCFFENERTRRARTLGVASALAVLGIYAFLHSLPAPRGTAGDNTWEPLYARVLLMLRALGDYTSILFFPARLTMDRSLTSAVMYRGASAWFAHVRLEYLSLLGTLALAACARWCVRGPARRLTAFAACWFFIAFLPISNLFPLNAEVAEHWIYLASIGYLLFLGACLAPHAARHPHLAAVLGLCALTALGVRTALRAGDWADQETFLKSTISAGGGSPRVLNNLANLYGMRGDLVKQEDVLRRTLQLFPEYAPARINLGSNLTKQKRTVEAEPLLSSAREQPHSAGVSGRQAGRAAANLANTQDEAGDTARALATLAEAHREFPEVWELVGLTAKIQREKQGAGAVLPEVERFAATHWWHRRAWLALGSLRFGAGDRDGAIDALRHASRLDLYDTEALTGIVEVERARQRPAIALDVQCEALGRSPDHPALYAGLADILRDLGRTGEASAADRKAQMLFAQAQRAGR